MRASHDGSIYYAWPPMLWWQMSCPSAVIMSSCQRLGKFSLTCITNIIVPLFHNIPLKIKTFKSLTWKLHKSPVDCVFLPHYFVCNLIPGFLWIHQLPFHEISQFRSLSIIGTSSYNMELPSTGLISSRAGHLCVLVLKTGLCLASSGPLISWPVLTRSDYCTGSCH